MCECVFLFLCCNLFSVIPEMDVSLLVKMASACPVTLSVRSRQDNPPVQARYVLHHQPFFSCL